jgi:hypothetical protein
MIQLPTASINRILATFNDQLTTHVRYARFQTDESAEEWAMLLGPDVIPRTHVEVTAQIAQELVDAYERHDKPLAQKNKQLLITAAWVHDWGELILDEDSIGDISFDQKTADHEQIEIAIFDRAISELADGEEKELLRRAYHEVVVHTGSHLSVLLNIVERVGYLRTCIRTFEGRSGKRITNWRGMVGNILANQIIPLLAYALDHPFVDQELTKHAATIDAMFAETLHHDIPPDHDNNPSFDSDKLLRAYQAWSSSDYCLATTNKE